MPILETAATIAKKGVEVGVKALEKTAEVTAELEAVKPDLEALKSQSFEALKESNKLKLHDGDVLSQLLENAKQELADKAKEIAKNNTDGTSIKEKMGLSEEETALIIKETGWPPEVVEYIQSMEQYEVYREANLHYAEIDGRPCLIKDIDMDYVDPKTGLTNRELLKKGRAPIDAQTGEKIELHHMGQTFDSPFAELCENSEHGDGKDGILHDKQFESWRNDPEMKNKYAVQREHHWKARAMEV